MVQAEGLEQQLQRPLGMLNKEAGVADVEGEREELEEMDRSCRAQQVMVSISALSLRHMGIPECFEQRCDMTRLPF